ncbi:VapC toxin family PIN domain ribonuclease [Massilia violaceinigra]|uniref:VapC toxin family PIN domain ribonuclease n=1 Tax=Massilia violaceinigra TaxID=2045208 RepID=A0A2D2DJH0_9BURK|nr:PIN domain nuclease [Massilia violaceinigra]ATQ75124.1 VapC toxin family PIN domain ribonuclease [Massilia violaceinigra]
MTLVDSSVWIDYFKGTLTPQTHALDVMLSTTHIAVGDLILTEVLQGFRTDLDFQLAKKMLTSLTVVDLGGEAVAIQAAQNFRKLRSMGITIRKTIDTVIATRCIMDDYELLYSDRDFDPFVAHFGLRSAIP